MDHSSSVYTLRSIMMVSSNNIRGTSFVDKDKDYSENGSDNSQQLRGRILAHNNNGKIMDSTNHNKDMNVVGMNVNNNKYPTSDKHTKKTVQHKTLKHGNNHMPDEMKNMFGDIDAQKQDLLNQVDIMKAQKKKEWEEQQLLKQKQIEEAEKAKANEKVGEEEKEQQQESSVLESDNNESGISNTNVTDLAESDGVESGDIEMLIENDGDVDADGDGSTSLDDGDGDILDGDGSFDNDDGEILDGDGSLDGVDGDGPLDGGDGEIEDGSFDEELVTATGREVGSVDGTIEDGEDFAHGG